MNEVGPEVDDLVNKQVHHCLVPFIQRPLSIPKTVSPTSVNPIEGPLVLVVQTGSLVFIFIFVYLNEFFVWVPVPKNNRKAMMMVTGGGGPSLSLHCKRTNHARFVTNHEMCKGKDKLEFLILPNYGSRDQTSISLFDSLHSSLSWTGFQYNDHSLCRS